MFSIIIPNVGYVVRGGLEWITMIMFIVKDIGVIDYRYGNIPDMKLKCPDCDSEELHIMGKDIVCQECTVVYHLCRGQDCPYETEPQV